MGEFWDNTKGTANASIVLHVEPLGAAVRLVAVQNAYYYLPMPHTFV